MSKLSLDSVEWGEFKLIDIFEIKDGYYNKKPPINEKTKGTIPFLGATKYENGITAFYDLETIKKWDKVGKINTHNYEDRLYRGNCLAVTNNGSVGNIYFQNHTFTCSHDVTPLYLKVGKLNKYIAHFLATMLRKTAESFEYAKKGRPERMRSSKIMLPIDSSSDPNWKFMEDYIKQEMKVQSRKVASYYENKLMKLSFDLLDLEVEWKEFFFTDIFKEIKRGKRLTKCNQIDGNTPYVSSTGINNGIDNFIDNDEKVRKYANNLSLANSGSVGSCFYHKYEYIASDHITALTSEYADEYIYKFMSTIISRLEEKYSFNREINDKRISREKLFLPIDKNGKPYWEYMSNFIKSLEKESIEKVIAYLYSYIESPVAL